MMIKKYIVAWFLGIGIMAMGMSLANAPLQNETQLMNKVKLGELLFNEKRLSLDTSISCASCHLPMFGFADTLALSKGVGGKVGTRNTPSVTNMSARPLLFLDGRANSLEHQVHFPINNAVEMDFTIAAAIKRLRKDKAYRQYFKTIYGQLPDSANLVDAIATFERSLETSNTPFDRWMVGDSSAMNAAAIRGREVFMSEKAKCFECHFSPDFTGDEFRNIGLYDGSPTLNDVGRFAITKDSSDLGRFRVPSLRNVGVTAPYMHNGAFGTLRQVIDYYDNPHQTVKNAINMDTLLQKPLLLTEQEKTDLEAFLHALTDVRFLKK